MTLVLRELAADDPLVVACQALRYRVYREDLGLDTLDMHHDVSLDIEASDPASDFFAVLDEATGEVVGTLRAQLSGGPIPLCAEREFDLLDPWFAARRLVEGARFAVAREHKDGLAPLMLFDAFRRYCRRAGVDHVVSIAIVPDAAPDPALSRFVFDWIAARTEVDLARAVPAAGFEPVGWDDGPPAPPPPEGIVRLPAMVRTLAHRRSTLSSIPGYDRRFRAWNFLLTTDLSRRLPA